MIYEPFRVKMVEPLRFLSEQEREKVLIQSGYNLFQIPARQVTFDFLTDSGTTAMSAQQWAAMMLADESYACSESFERFQKSVQDLTGYPYVIPTHQGRAAERILFSHLIKPGTYVPSNTHFDTTRANIEYLGGHAVDLLIEEGSKPNLVHSFKGNMDISKLEAFCETHLGSIPCIMLTVTNNGGGGQPVSMKNIEDTSAVCKRFHIPLILDVCRFAENSYFIKKREKEYSNWSIPDIAKKTFQLADGCMMSAKKDGLVNIGGFIALKANSWVEKLHNLLILTEGFPTYGGLAARDLEAMAVGLREVLDEKYLEYRLRSCEYVAEALNKAGIPTMQPTGGHAVFIDAKALLPHIPPEHFPGQALACELYRTAGIRSCEIGSAMFGKNAKMELVRLAFPRRAYTQSHMDYVIEVVSKIPESKHKLKGFKLIHEPPFLRHFTGRFQPIENTL